MGNKSANIPNRCVFLLLLYSQQLSVPKWSWLKIFAVVILVSLTFRACPSVWNLWKNVSDFTAVQQQTGAFRHQKSDSSQNLV